MTAGSAAITGWTVGWTYANGQGVTQHWNAQLTSGRRGGHRPQHVLQRRAGGRRHRDLRLPRLVAGRQPGAGADLRGDLTGDRRAAVHIGWLSGGSAVS